MDNMFNGGTIGVEQIQQMAYLLSNPQLLQNLELMSGISLGNSSIERTLPKRYAINQELEFTQEVDGIMKLIGKGSVYEIKGRNKWGVAYYFEDDNGVKKRKVRTFENEEEAQRFLDKTIKNVENGNKVKVVETTRIFYDESHRMKNYIKYYLEEKSLFIKKSTYDGYVSLNRAIERHIGEIYLEALEVGHIKQLFMGIRDKEHVGERKIESVYMWLKMILRKARIDGIIERDIMEALPKRDVKKMVLNLPEHYKKDIEIISEENIELLKKYMKNDTYRTMIEVIEYTGLRAGEACALQWENIDFKNKRVHVVHNLTTRIDKRSTRVGTSQVALTTPKTASSSRKIHMNETLYKILKDWEKREKSSKEKERIASCGTEKLLFTNVMGNPIIPGTLLKGIKNVCEKHGIYEVDEKGKKYLPHTHMIRHLTATRLLDRGVQLTTVSKILGHTDTQTTAIYITIREELEKEAMRRLDA